MNFFLIGAKKSGKTQTTESIRNHYGTNVNVFESDDFDVDNKAKYFDYFLKKFFLNNTAIPFHFFLMVINYENGQFTNFELTAKFFGSVFGSCGIHSLLLLILPTDNKHSNEREIYSFENSLSNSDGYKYLIQKSNLSHIQYCLWDNFKNTGDQYSKFEAGLTKIVKNDEDCFSKYKELIEISLELVRQNEKVAYEETDSSSPKFNYILMGNASAEIGKSFLKQYFPQTQFRPEYDLDRARILVNFDMCMPSFDLASFKSRCVDLKQNLNRIILLEHFNKKTSTIESSIKILFELFELDEINNKLNIHFYTNSNVLINTRFADYTNVFSFLFKKMKIDKDKDKQIQFLKNRIYVFYVLKED